MNTQKLLSVTEAATVLNVSPHTLRGWVSQRRIRFVKVGRRTMFRLAAIEAFIDVNLVEPRHRREGQNDA